MKARIIRVCEFSFFCDGHGGECEKVIEVGETQDYDSATARLCPKCFQEAIEVAKLAGFIE